MGYKIKYGQTVRKRTVIDRNSVFYKGAVLTFTLLGAVLVLYLGSTGLLRQLLIPGNPDITQAAFTTMMSNLSDGMLLTDALTAFCQEIIQYANVT